MIHSLISLVVISL